MKDRFTQHTRPGFSAGFAARLESLNDYRNLEWGIFSAKHFEPDFGVWLPRMTTGFDRSSRYTYAAGRSRDLVIRVIASVGYNGFCNRDGTPRDRVTMTFCPVLKDEEVKLGRLLEGLSNPPRGTDLFLMSISCVAHFCQR